MPADNPETSEPESGTFERSTEDSMEASMTSGPEAELLSVVSGELLTLSSTMGSEGGSPAGMLSGISFCVTLGPDALGSVMVSDVTASSSVPESDDEASACVSSMLSLSSMLESDEGAATES